MSGFVKACYAVIRTILADGKDLSLQANQRGDLAVMEQFIPSGEDNANGIYWDQERAVADSLGAWTGGGTGATKVGTAGAFIKAAAGRLRKILGANTHATNTYYLLAFNKATAPVANDLPFAAVALAPNPAATFGMSVQGIDFPGGAFCSTGIAYAISTTPEKLTLPASSDCVVWWFIA